MLRRMCRNTKKLDLLHLPIELRLIIFEYVIGSPTWKVGPEIWEVGQKYLHERPRMIKFTFGAPYVYHQTYIDTVDLIAKRSTFVEANYASPIASFRWLLETPSVVPPSTIRSISFPNYPTRSLDSRGYTPEWVSDLGPLDLLPNLKNVHVFFDYRMSRHLW